MQTTAESTLNTSVHTFNRAADKSIAKAHQVSHTRAGEYHDSWSVDNLVTPWLDNLLKAWPACPKTPAEDGGRLEREYKRLIIMASMLDIKISRLGGGWKEDTAIDTINYCAAYCTLREEFEDRFRFTAAPNSGYSLPSAAQGVTSNGQARLVQQFGSL